MSHFSLIYSSLKAQVNRRQKQYKSLDQVNLRSYLNMFVPKMPSFCKIPKFVGGFVIENRFRKSAN